MRWGRVEFGECSKCNYFPTPPPPPPPPTYSRLAKETAARKKAEDALKGVQKQLADKEAQLGRAMTEAHNLEGVVHELRKECQELKEALESAKYALEEETLTRVDLENKLQSAKEELSFKKQMHEKVGGCCVLKFPWTNKKLQIFLWSIACQFT